MNFQQIVKNYGPNLLNSLARASNLKHLSVNKLVLNCNFQAMNMFSRKDPIHKRKFPCGEHNHQLSATRVNNNKYGNNIVNYGASTSSSNNNVKKNQAK